MGGTGGVWRWFSLLLVAPILSIALLAASSPPAPAAALDSEEDAFLQLINEYRVANGVGPLTLNGKLNDAAFWMSHDMAVNDYFSHTDALGRDPYSRMADFGYTYNTWKGENLAAGVAAAQAAFDLFKGSPGHNENMLYPTFTVIGISRAYGEASTFGWYWATEFGGQGEPLPPAQPPARHLAEQASPGTATQPQPAPATEAPPPPEATPEPTQVTTPTAAPTATPSPTATSPVGAPLPLAPCSGEAAARFLETWARLMVLDADGSLLASICYTAELYLAPSADAFVREESPPPEVLLGSPPPGQV